MRLITRRLVAPALFLAAGLMVVAAGGAVGQPGKDKEPGKEKKDKDKGPKGGPEKGEKKFARRLTGSPRWHRPRQRARRRPASSTTRRRSTGRP